MTYTEWYEEVLERVEEQRPLTLWLRAGWFGVVVLLLTCAYWLLQQGSFDVWTFNRALAGTAFILVALSFGLSGLCYFWNFVDTKIIYRKYIGILGFYVAVMHIGTTIALLRGVTDLITYYNVPVNLISVLFAVPAIFIFFAMVIISNEYAVHELGATRWRQLLRVGYVGLLLSMAHYLVRRYDEWGTWLVERETFLPPISLLLLILGIFVLVLRLALWISLREKQQPNA